MAGNFGGKSIIVTGGGNGIGAACARHLAGLGATVVICGRTKEKLDAVAGGGHGHGEGAGEEQDAGGSIHPVVADVTQD